MQVKKAKATKYKNKKVIINGELFDSKKEAQRWLYLKAKEKAGEITDLQKQVKFVLIPSQRQNGKLVERECSYYADFVYKVGESTIVEDVKGYKSGGAYAIFKVKKKLMLFVHKIRVLEV